MEPEVVTVDELSKTFSKAAADGYLEAMRTIEAERKAAGPAVDDPLVTDAIEKRVDEMYEKRLGEEQAKWQLARDREAAEKNMVQPGAAKHVVADVLPNIKSLVGIKLVDGDHEPRRATPMAPGDYEPQLMTEIEREACKLHDMLMVIRCRARDKDATCRRYLRAQGLNDEMIAKTLDTYTTSYGVEWVNSVFSTEFSDRIALGGKVLPLFYRFPMAAKAVTCGGQTGAMTAYRGTANENTATTADTTGLSTNVAFSAEELNIYQPYSDSLDADAVIATGPKLAQMMIDSCAEWLDKCVMDGDTAGTMDSDWSASTDPRKSWDGLRLKVTTDTGAFKDLSTFDADTLLTILGAMTGYSENPEKLSWIFPTKTFWTKLFTLTDNSTNKNSVFLPCTPGLGIPPIVTGQIGLLLGSPVTVSGLARTNLNASGIYDGTMTTQAVCYLVHRDSWWYGDRQMVAVESQHMVKTRNTDVVLSVRGDFQHMRGTDLTTGAGYNIA